MFIEIVLAYDEKNLMLSNIWRMTIRRSAVREYLKVSS